MKLRVEVIVVSMLVGAILGCHWLCSCSKVSLQEGMSMVGSALDHKMGEGVKDSWDTRRAEKGPVYDWRQQNHDAALSDMTEPDSSMFFFQNTEFKPECCGSSYTSAGGVSNKGVSSGGCACMSKQQIDFLNTRGGNRTAGGQF